MSAASFLLFLAGLGLLIGGAEVLVRGASRLASLAGLSHLVIGLTVVAYGTSAPELAVGLQGVLSGREDLALGNIIGSNIFNVLFILGASALAAPLLVSAQLVRLDVPIMLGSSLLVWALAADGRVGRWDGLLLLLLAAGYTALQLRMGRQNGPPESSNETRAARPAAIAAQLGLVIAGVALLALGSRWLVRGAVEIATWMGVSPLVIGLTIVAAGTSLPEAATSVLSALRGERDIAVGNVVGSNIFNLFLILGAAALFAPSGIPVTPAVLKFDFPVMIAVAAVCLPLFYTGAVVSRLEGLLLLAYYGAYALYLILSATEHDALEGYAAALLYYAIPLTVLVLAVSVWRHRRSAPARGSGTM